jgi:imidazolonepropionase-like amidohydrolase
MKSPSRSIRVSAILVCLSFNVPAQTIPAETVLIKAARVLDVAAGRYLTSQGIVVEGGVFKQIAPWETARAAAPDARVIDLGNLSVIPGLIDCHTHLMLSLPDSLEGGDALILTAAKMSTGKRVLLGAEMAKEYLQSGFTSVRNLGHSGIDGDAALRDAISNGWVPGPRIFASARKITPVAGQALLVQDGLLDAFVNQEFLAVSNPDEGRRAVLEDLHSGATVIKVVADDGRRMLNLDTMRAIVDEAHKVNVKVASHASSTLGIQMSIEAGVDSIEHADGATEQQFQAMRAKGIFLVPTLWPKELTIQWPGLPAVGGAPASRGLDRETWLTQYVADQRKKMDLARKTGVRIAFGSDERFIRSISRGEATLELLAGLEEFGMTPAEVLRAATIDAAELLGTKNFLGSIEPKKLADLVAIDGDPLGHLPEIDKVKFVMMSGRVVRNDAHPVQ